MGIGAGAAEHRPGHVLREDRIEDQHIAGTTLKLVNRPNAHLLLQAFMSQHPIEEFHLGTIGRHDRNGRMGSWGREHLLGEFDTEQCVIDVVRRPAMIAEGRGLSVLGIDENQRAAGGWSEVGDGGAKGGHVRRGMIIQSSFGIEAARDGCNGGMHPILSGEGHDAGIVTGLDLGDLIDAATEPLSGGRGFGRTDGRELEKIPDDNDSFGTEACGMKDRRERTHAGFFNDDGVVALVLKEP